MTRATHSPLYVTKELLETRYPGASVIFVAGSVGRGTATAHSDLDLVIVFPKIERAYRESFTHLGWPVEAFIHDPETLRYFFTNVDRQIGRATLAEMIAEGHEVPGASEFSTKMKNMASECLREGPPALPEEDVQDRRYHISELIDDLREPRTRPELHAAASYVYVELADYVLRSRRGWTGSGKSVLKRLRQEDPALNRRFSEAFDELFTNGQSQKVIELASDILSKEGGFLFDGYRRECPPTWRA